MSPERVLVTGATGFIGRHIAAALAATGCTVLGVASRVPDANGQGIEWHAADLLAPGQASWTLPGDTPWPESRPIAPATPYGQAKCRAADEVRAFCALHGLSFAWARLFLLFGHDEQPGRLVPSVASALLQGREAKTGSGRHVRDFCEAAWAGRAIAELARSDVKGPVNIGSGQPVRIGALTALIAELCNRPDMLRQGALPDRPEDPPYMVADVRRLRGEVGFAEPFDLDAALAAVIDGLRRRA